MKPALLSVQNVAISFKHGSEQALRAVDGVSLAVHEREALGLVGESGSGKSTLGKMIAGLLTPMRGRIDFNGKTVTGLSCPSLQLVFQDSAAALNPRMSIRALVEEGLIIQGVSKKERTVLVNNVIRDVGLDPALLMRYPHQVSGGQRQRVALARALIMRPKLLILDEPVSSLDVTAGAHLLRLLRELQQKENLSYILIAHDLAVVRQVCQRVAIMYMGKIVETGTVGDVFTNPRHGYTQMLLEAHPSPDPARRTLTGDGGEPGNPFAPPSGCRFHPRCQHALPKCRHVPPGYFAYSTGHRAACHLQTSDNKTRV